MPSITQPIQNLIQAALEEKHSKEIDTSEPRISITTRTAQASFIYERMRNAVDYKEEHLVRRNAIERILRRIISSGHRENLAENFITELIHARYIPNNAIPQKKIAQLDEIFEKYFTLLGAATLKEVNNKNTFAGWIIGITATEIDEFLVPPHIMHASINAMYEYMRKKIHIEDNIDADERLKQIYIASSRALYKNDDDTLSYHMLLVYCPQWTQDIRQIIKETGVCLPKIRSTIQKDLSHPIKEKLAPIFRKYVGYFTILRDSISQDAQSASADLRTEEEFCGRIRNICKKNYQKSRESLHRGIRRSIVYLVITKFLLAIILEIPVEYLIAREIAYLPLAINLVFPPSLLAVIALSTKLPDDENTSQMIMGIRNIITGNGEIIQIRKVGKRGMLRQSVFVLLYGSLFIISFGMMIYVLRFMNFTIVGILVFLFFLSLVSLFAYRIRLSNQELIVTPPKSGIIRSLWAFFTIPVLHAGKWMSMKFAKINVFIFVLDFVIEAPFKAFIKVIEEWMNYVHEKKEEI